MTWESLTESSHVLRAWRAATSGSVVVATLRRLVARVPVLGRDVQRAPGESDDRAARVVMENSAIVRGAAAVVARIDDVCRESQTGRRVSAIGDRWLALTLPERIRLGALTLLSALAVHVLATRFAAPAPILIARVAWSIVAALLIGVMVGAEALAAAWVDWKSRR